MNDKDAKYCHDCKEFFEGSSTCPKCGGTAWSYVWYWLNPQAGKRWLGRLERKAA